jgi:Xaa-Pro aminopeptidase
MNEPAESARAPRLAALLPEHDLDALLVSAPANVRYLSGFDGSNGLILVLAAGAPWFVTDFRYATQSEAQVPARYERRVVQVDLLQALVGPKQGEDEGEGESRGGDQREEDRPSGDQREGDRQGEDNADERHAAAAPAAGETEDPKPLLGNDVLAAGGRLGFDDAALTVRQHSALRERLDERFELVAAGGLVEGLRECKEPQEVARIRAAAELADAALRELLEGGLAGRSERDVAIELELRMRRLGASAPSFPTIVASGVHSALPHAQPRDQPIAANTLVTIDWGALHDGYCSDCTRTYATGEHVPGEQLAVYDLVLRAQLAGLDAVRPGPTGIEVDAAARAVIDDAGHGEHFGHGLGHGVGLEVHEAPRLSRTAPKDRHLRAGQIVTVEPGVYVPGLVGVRIEDLVLVTDVGATVLSGLAKELTVVG